MTLLDKFKKADNKVTNIENKGGIYLSGYGGITESKEYQKALKEAQRLHKMLVKNGINPF